jgi:hypothetical protein
MHRSARFACDCFRSRLRLHEETSAQTSMADLHLDVKIRVQFIAYGDTRFQDPSDTDTTKPPV